MDLSSTTLNGPEWASGCPSCSYGLVAAPEIVSTIPLSEGRAVQAAEDMILFCECRAGFMYRQHLRRIYGAMGMETRKNLRDIVTNAMRVPTVHAAGEPASA